MEKDPSMEAYCLKSEYINLLKFEESQHFRECLALENGGGLGVLAGTVSAVHERRSKSGNLYAFVEFSDPTGQFEAVTFSDTLNAVSSRTLADKQS